MKNKFVAVFWWRLTWVFLEITAESGLVVKTQFIADLLNTQILMVAKQMLCLDYNILTYPFTCTYPCRPTDYRTEMFWGQMKKIGIETHLTAFPEMFCN